MTLVLGVFGLFCIGWCLLLTKRNVNKMVRNEAPVKDIKEVKHAFYIVVAVFIMQLLNVASMVYW